MITAIFLLEPLIFIDRRIIFISRIANVKLTRRFLSGILLMEPSESSGTKRVYGGTGENLHDATKKIRMFENREDLDEKLVVKLNDDLNTQLMEEDIDSEKRNQTVLVFDLNGPVNEDINISSNGVDDKMLQKGVNRTIDLELYLGMNEYRVEKRASTKARVKDDFLSLSLPYGSKQLKKEKGKADDDDVFSSSPTYDFQKFDILNDTLELDAIKVMESLAAMKLTSQDVQISENKETGSSSKAKVVSDDTHTTSTNDYLYSYENGMTFFKRSDFSREIRAIIDRRIEEKTEQSIFWIPHQVDDVYVSRVPSLLDLSFNVLSKNLYSVPEIHRFPIWIKRNLMYLLCENRKLDICLFELLFGCSPAEICVYDCSWMTESVLADMLKKPNMHNLKVLQLDYWKHSFANIIPKSLVRDINSLPCLTELSLKGAARLCDHTLKLFLVSAPLIQSLDLRDCPLLTHYAVNMISYYLNKKLIELNIDDCSGINVMRCLSSMTTFENLKVLSVAGSETVCDEFVTVTVKACRRNLRSINVASCVKLTDKCLQAIGELCTPLFSLDISNLCKITDLGLCYLGNGCKSLRYLNVAHDDFSDEILATFLKTSGDSLMQLSLDHVVKVGFKTAFAVAIYLRNLEYLSLSGCHRLTDEALGFITDHRSSLKVLNVYGCTQVTDRFRFGHGNAKLQILG